MSYWSRPHFAKTFASVFTSIQAWLALVLQGENGVTVYTKDEQVISAPCTLAEPRGAIGIIDAAAVAVAAGVNLGLEVTDIAHLANAACECIMSGTQNFTVTSDDLANRLGEVAWSLQISQR